MKHIYLVLASIMLIAFSSCKEQPVSYLHAENINIVDGNGNNVLLRGIGTGNWMIQEGYMMKTGSSAPTQHDYRNKLIELIGHEKTDSFYNIWLDNHFTRADLDSMKAWGFNSVRPALHYLWFTPPIEDEPVPGEITWIDKGFTMLDSLVKWCSENEMYLILDMHGAPGGQGKNASISDYDPNKPSLWESDANKEKLIALWRKIAERYANEPWIGGYDLINETNWDFEDSDNENGCNCTQNLPLKEMFEELIDAIREVDNNHIIHLEGNCWANNYNGLESLASYDDNLVFSFHKYWNYNNQESIEWIINLRDSLNVPIWMSESGENSNTWFTNAVHLLESNNIGWSWWPVKKTRVNNPIQVQTNNDYLYLLEYFEGKIEKPTVEQSTNAIFTWADRHRTENCIIKYDVIDALIRQPHSTATKPFKPHTPQKLIYAVDYDYGRNGYAYFDADTGNYRTVGVNMRWNKGMEYRNDGVDIHSCDNEGANSNGYVVFSTEDNEWLQYTILANKTAEYTLSLRYSSETAAQIHVICNEKPLEKTDLKPSENNEEWTDVVLSGLTLNEGENKLRIVFDKGGAQISSFKLNEN